MTILNFFNVGNPVFLVSRRQVRPPARSKLVLVQDERFDADWDRLVDWAGAPASPLEIMTAFDLQGLWAGTLSWTDQPQPEFAVSALFLEHFNTGWIGTNVAPVNALVVSGTAALDQTLTADVSGLVDEDGLPASNTYQYQWQWETSPDVFEDIAGETGTTYLVTRYTMGKRVRFRLQYQDLLLNDETLYSVATAVVPVVDIPVEGAPTIQNLTSAGQPAQQGHVLSAVTTAIFDFNTIASAFSYQWLRETAVGSNTYVEIDGATSQTYAVQAADIAPNAADTRYVKVRVSYTDGLGKLESVDSVSGYATIDSAFSGTPTIDSSTVVFDVGTVLTANVSALQDANDPLTYEYQWYAEVFGSPGTFLAVSGATDAVFNVTSDYQKRKLYLEVTTIDALGNRHTRQTAQTTRVNSLPEGAPYITGTFQVGQTLSANTSQVSDYDTIGTKYYQWFVKDPNAGDVWVSAQNNSTTATYVVKASDINKQVKVRLSYTDTLGKAEQVDSAPILIVNTAPTGVPTISVNGGGNAEVGKTLSAIVSGIADINTIPGGTGAYLYQWFIKDPFGANTYSPIAGATSSSYLVQYEDVSQDIKVEVSFTDLGGVLETVVSTALRVANSLPTGELAIVVSEGGDPEAGKTLIADPSDISDVNGLGTFSYQWYRSDKYKGGSADSAISGATSATYVIPVEDEGYELYVRGTVTDLDPRDPKTYIFRSSSTIPVGSVGNFALGSTVTFDGNDEFVVSGLTPSTFSSGISIAMRVFNAGGVGYKGLINNGVAGSDTSRIGSFDLRFSSNTSIFLTINRWTSSELSASWSLPANVWTTLVVTYDNRTIRVYSNGSLIASSSTRSYSASLANVSTSGMRIGRSAGTGEYFVGQLQNVLFYNKALNSQEIINATSAIGAGGTLSTDFGGSTVLRVKAGVSGQPVITGRATTSAILTADTSSIADENGLGTFSYQWKVDGVNVGSNSTTYTVQTADYGKDVTVTVSYTDKAGYPETLTSEPLTIINYRPTGQLTISGTPQVSYTLTAGGLVDADGITPANVTYQWLSAGVEVQNSTDPTYVVQPTDYAKQIVVRASYTDDSGNVETPDLYSVLTAAAVTIVNSPPTGEVYVLDQQGNQPAGVEEGVVLVADPSAVRDINEYDDQTPDSFTYQWKRNGVAISGQTAQTYTTRFSEYGGAISVTVTYTDDHGNVESVTSTNSVNIINSPPVGDVLITGEPRVGMTLTADPSGITDVNYIAEPSYILDYPEEYTVSGGASYIDNTVVPGRSALRWGEGTGAERTVTFNQPTLFIGLQFYRAWQQSTSVWYAEYLTVDDVWVRYASGQNNDGWTPVTPSVTNGHVLAKAVRFSTYSYTQSGLSMGHVTIKTGPRPDTHVFAYQWFRDGVSIAGATQKNYTLVEADYGTNLTVRASYNDLHGTAESVTSSIPVLVDARGYPALVGPYEVGATVTVDTSSMDDVEGVGTLHYAWEAKLPGDAAFSAVGTDSSSFVVPVGYEAATLRVTVSYTDLQGNPESAMSEVVYVRSDVTGAIALSGRDPSAYYVGDVVTADVSALEDLSGFPTPDLITYEWRRNDTPITSRDSSAIYEQTIEITSSSAVSNYHVEVVLNTKALITAGKMHSDSRVEFRDDAGNLVPYWFEGPENHEKTTYWLKLDLPSGVTTLTARYSVDASFACFEGRASDMGFSFFEDFDNGLDNWTKTGADGVLAVQNGVLVGTNTSAYLQSVQQFSTPVIARAVVNFPDSPPNGLTSLGFWNSTTDLVSILEHNSTSYYRSGDYSQFTFDGEGVGVVKDEIFLTGTQAQVRRVSATQQYTSGFFNHTQGTKPLFLGMRDDLNNSYVGQNYSGTWYYIHVRPYVAGVTVSVALGAESLTYGSVYKLVPEDSGQSINVVMSYTDLQGYAESLASPAVSVSNSPATGSIVLTGQPYTGEVLTVDTSGLADLDGLDNASFAYAWFLNGAEIVSETSSTYTVTAADVNQTITASVSFNDLTGQSYTVTSPGRLILNTPATGEALLTGTAAVGETLTLDMSPVSDVDGAIQNVTYQWYEAPARNLLLSAETPVADATASTLVIPAGSENKEYRAVVSYEDGNGGTYTQRVPKLAGVPEQDLALLLDAASLDSYTFGTTSWNDLSGNGNHATVPSTVWSTASQGRFVFSSSAWASLNSADLLNLGNDFTISGLVYVSGSGNQTAIFSNYKGDNNPVTGISVAIYNNTINLFGSAGWFSVNYVSVSGLASNAYYFITVKVTGANTSYPHVQVYINGQEGAKTWQNGEYRSTYVSYNGAGAIAWGSDPSYVYVGRRHDLTYPSNLGLVAVHKRALSDEEIASMHAALRDRLDAASPQRKIVQGTPLGLPTISGTPQAGSVLTANTAAISDPNGRASNYTYQWKADGVNISGATSSTYTLTANQFNKQVTVTATFTDRLGQSYTLESAPVLVENTPATGTVTISGTPEVNQTLTAVTSGLQDVNGLPAAASMTYQWYVDNALALESAPAVQPWTGVTDGLVLRLADQYSGNTWLDLSGQDNHAELVNASISGNTANLTATNDAARVATNPGSFMRNSFTHMAWVYFTGDSGGYNGIFWAEGAFGLGSGTQFLLSVIDPDTTNSYFHTRVNNSSTGWINVNTGVLNKSFLNVWRHVSWSFDNGVTKIYLDGVLVHTDSSRGSYSGGTTSPFYIGARNDVTFGNSPMRVATVECYNRALSLAEIQQNMTATQSLLNSDGTAGALGTSATPSYVVQPDDVFKDVRVDVSFTDNQGNAEGPFSASTTIQNSLPTGTFEIQGATDAVGSLLSVDVSGIDDPNGMGLDFEYQWSKNNVAIPGAVSPDYFTTSLDLASASEYKVEASYVDQKGTREILTASKAAVPASAGLYRKVTTTSSTSPIANSSGTLQTTPSTSLFSETGKLISHLGYFVPPATGTYSLELSASAGSYVWLGESAQTAVGAEQDALLAGNLVRVSKSYTTSASYYGTGGASYSMSVSSSDTGNVPTVAGPVTVSISTSVNSYLSESAILRLSVISPSGTTVILKDYGVYGFNGVYTTSAFIGESGLGTWRVSWSRTGGTSTSFTWTFYSTSVAFSVGSIASSDQSFVAGVAYPIKAQLSRTSVVPSFSIKSGSTTYTNYISHPKVFDGFWDFEKAHTTPLTGTVSVSGVPQQGQTLSALRSGDWAGQSSGFTYQWYKNDQEIWGARNATYTVQASDFGQLIKVRAAYTDPQSGLSSTATSTAVTIVNSPPVGNLLISGGTYAGQTLTATVSFSDANGIDNATLAYQWYADGVAIPDATASTYVVAEALGTALSVTASYQDNLGNSESVTSAAVAVTSAPPTGSVTIAGTYRVGQVLTATVDVSDADGIQEGTTVYQWMRNGVDIADATALSYTLVDADIGQSVAMEVRYTDNLGEQEALASAAAVVLGYPVVVANPLADQDTYAGLAVSFVAPADAFSDPDGGALTYAASGMPAWLAFDAATRTFSGTPSVDDAGVSTITVTATDSDADSASDAFDMTVHARVTESFEFDGDDRWPGTLPEAEPTPGFNYSSASTSFDPSSGWPAPPVISGSASLTVEENIDAATVLETYTADKAVTWSKAGTDAAAFSLDAASGELRFVQSPDFETKSSYALTIVATDASGNVSTQAVSVSVTDVDEVNPVVSGPDSVTVQENTDAATVLGTYTANEAVTWSLAGTDAADFSINSAGGLRLLQSPDFETKSSYAVTVVATDAAGNVSTQAVSVSVTSADAFVSTGLVLHYDVADSNSYPGSGALLSDLVGSTDGNITSPVYSTDGGGSLVLASGRSVDIPSSLSVFSADFSVSCWYKNTATDSSSYKILFETEGYRSGPNGFSMYVLGDYFSIWRTGTSMITTSAGTAGVNVWKYVTLKRENGVFSLYINGVQSGGTHSNSDDFSFSNYNISHNSYPFVGNFGKLEVYSRALSLSEIQQNFNATKARFGL